MATQPDPNEPKGALSLEALAQLFGRNTRLVLATVAFGLAARVAVVAWRAPSYRARATLILDDPSASSGILGELAMLGKAPAAAAQIELLRARSTAEDRKSVV